MAAVLPDILISPARREDLPALVAMFSADAHGGHGDTTEAEA
ncbi:GNAT family N-acetyltransferase, partial [Rhizobium johnstonii]